MHLLFLLWINKYRLFHTYQGSINTGYTRWCIDRLEGVARWPINTSPSVSSILLVGRHELADLYHGNQWHHLTCIMATYDVTTSYCHSTCSSLAVDVHVLIAMAKRRGKEKNVESDDMEDFQPSTNNTVFIPINAEVFILFMSVVGGGVYWRAVFNYS